MWGFIDFLKSYIFKLVERELLQKQIIIIPYTNTLKYIWNNFLSECYHSTFLHNRDYLEYHKDRFIERSLIIQIDNKVVALFPAAEDRNNRNIIISHPGITYGGLLFSRKIYGENLNQIFKEIFNFYFKSGVKEIIYKSVPIIYHRSPSQDDIHCLISNGAKLIRTDLSCTIDLQNSPLPNLRRRRSLNKAQNYKVSIFDGFKEIDSCWDVLTSNLSTKYEKKPVHNVDEIVYLHNLFPQKINCFAAKFNEEVVASIIIYKTDITWHAQYISSNQLGKKINALDFLFNHIIEIAKEKSIRWFDFGTSTELNGLLLNNSLYTFKHEFGGGGILYQFFSIKAEKYKI